MVPERSGRTRSQALRLGRFRRPRTKYLSGYPPQALTAYTFGLLNATKLTSEQHVARPAKAA